jgi:murein L,D-transpeptidase YafK
MNSSDNLVAQTFRHSRKLALLLLALAGALILPLQNLPLYAQSQAKIDRIVIEKGQRTLELMDGPRLVKSYKVALGENPKGAKDRQGDHKTPEGLYSVDSKNPNSQFHKGLHISYPNPADREHAKKRGVSPGGDVEIHGLGANWDWVGAGHRITDWTDGCIALTNEEIGEIYPLVKVGTPVEIRP